MKTKIWYHLSETETNHETLLFLRKVTEDRLYGRMFWWGDEWVKYAERGRTTRGSGREIREATEEEVSRVKLKYIYYEHFNRG